MNDRSIRETIETYARLYPEDDIAALQEFVARNTELISRKNPEGHVTASVVVLNKDGEVLLIENPKFPGKVIFPGGHLDATDASVEQGALRELREEMGMDTSALRSLTELEMPLDIDSHWIEANPKKGEGRHQHHDFRFAFVCDTFPEFTADKAEVQSVLFLALQKLQQSPMHARIADKIQTKIGK